MLGHVGRSFAPRGYLIDRTTCGNSCPLLDRMREFMSKEQTAVRRPGSILSCSENDVAPDSVSSRLHHLCQLRRATVGVHPHPAEVVAEPRLEERLFRLRQRLPRARQDIAPRDVITIAAWLALTRRASALERWRGGTCRKRRTRFGVRVRQTHDLLGHVIRFLLVLITRCAYCQLGLKIWVVRFAGTPRAAAATSAV